MNPLLTVTGLSKSFGGLSALKEISLRVNPGQIVGIIGPNGAGKTTLFNCFAGLYHPTEGQIEFQGRSFVPDAVETTRKQVRKWGLSSLILGILWLPLFWSFFLPDAVFKLEMTLLGVFILGIRFLLIRGLMLFQIWAWGLMFVFLLSDLCFALWWLTHSASELYLVGTRIPLGGPLLAWSISAGLFSIFLCIRMSLRQVRQLYGFRLSPDAVCRLGMARTFQNIRLFFNLSVLDNVRLGHHVQMKSGVPGALFRTRTQREEEALAEKEALEALRFVGLEERAFDLAGSLAYGEQRRLEIARALASRPKLLLLDEPAAGMNARESSRLIDLVRNIREDGIAVLIIEHDMRVMMNLADHIYVLDYGRLIAEGTPDEIRSNPKVIKAYLGGGGAIHAES